MKLFERGHLSNVKYKQPDVGFELDSTSSFCTMVVVTWAPTSSLSIVLEYICRDALYIAFNRLQRSTISSRVFVLFCFDFAFLFNPGKFFVFVLFCFFFLVEGCFCFYFRLFLFCFVFCFFAFLCCCFFNC